MNSDPITTTSNLVQPYAIENSNLQSADQGRVSASAKVSWKASRRTESLVNESKPSLLEATSKDCSSEKAQSERNRSSLAVRKASPCPYSWNQMSGDERVRWCKPCRHFVYNPASLNTTSLYSQIWFREGLKPSVLYRRKDGMLMTGDCQTGARKVRSTVAFAGLLLVGCALLCALCAAQKSAQPELSVTTITASPEIKKGPEKDSDTTVPEPYLTHKETSSTDESRSVSQTASTDTAIPANNTGGTNSDAEAEPPQLPEPSPPSSSNFMIENQPAFMDQPTGQTAPQTGPSQSESVPQATSENEPQAPQKSQ